MDVKRARKILGKEGKNLTDQEILDIINMFNRLADALYEELHESSTSKLKSSNFYRNTEWQSQTNK